MYSHAIGERTPEKARFENTGLPKLWPYCNSAKQMIDIVMADNKSSNSPAFEWQRRLEMLGTLGFQSAKKGATLCDMAELTDKGRLTMLDLGRRIRHLYVHQLGFLPNTIGNANMVYLRSTPFQRTITSLHQVFAGLYPQGRRDMILSSPVLVTQRLEDEYLVPNFFHCQRFSQLRKAFTRRTAARWDSSTEMEYLNSLMGKWMPPGQPVAVDSMPNLHGIFDTINSTLASDGPETTLPPEFYDAKARKIIERIVLEEEFAGFKESREYRSLGIGPLLSEVVQRMVSSAATQEQVAHSLQEDNNGAIRNGGNGLKIALFSCHDSTLAAILASVGAMDLSNETWPPYSSSLAVELFQERDSHRNVKSHPPGTRPDSGGLYVRMRYNDRAMTIPGCQSEGRHLHGDKSFCTLSAFKEIVTQFAPSDWKQACLSNLDKPGQGGLPGF
ncbi:hypothetical protein MMC28_001190 [Mycoblastus sanguinarius]|nr:hypothetical protein [Mycoblastus sanguinarius]